MCDVEIQKEERIKRVYEKLSRYSDRFHNHAAEALHDRYYMGRFLIEGKLLCIYAIRVLKEEGFFTPDEIPDLWDCASDCEYTEDPEEREDVFFLENQNMYAEDIDRLLDAFYRMGGWTVDYVSIDQVIGNDMRNHMEQEELNAHLEMYLLENPEVSYMKDSIMNGIIFERQSDGCQCEEVVSLYHPALFNEVNFLERNPDIRREDGMADLFMKLYDMAIEPHLYVDDAHVLHENGKDLLHIVFYYYVADYDYVGAFLLNPLHLAAAVVLKEAGEFLARKYGL